MNFRRLAVVFVMLVLPLLLATAGRVALAQEGNKGTAAATSAGGIGVEPAGPVDLRDIQVTERNAASFYSTALDLSHEVEPNDDPAQANALSGDTAVVRGLIYPNADLDYYSFTAAAGDRVYAAVMTSASTNGSTDSTLQLLDSDGTTVLEQDLDDGTFGAQSSTIAGAELPSAGTYYLRVSHSSATNQLRPYHLHFRLQSGSPTAEAEPNDSIATAQPLPASGWIAGELSSTADIDYYSLVLNAGDTIYASLDLDPTRDNTQWNGQLGLAIFGGFILVINDGSTGSPTNPLSEAHFMTVKESGTYYVRVNVPTGGSTFGDYTLSVTVHPAAVRSCTTYTSTDVPVVISDGAPSMVTSTLTVPGNPTIGDLNVFINLNHTFMSDLDVALYSPAGNTNALFNDIGSTTSGGPSVMNMIVDQQAAIPLGAYTAVEGMSFQPEFNFDLGWYNGEDAGGEWTLVIWDDAPGDGGTLLGWGIEICEPVEPPPMCAPGFILSTVYSSDFESGDGGFTHSGTADEWELGLPTADPITSCHSGTNCWKTDLDGTYDASSDQDLFSPVVDLSGYNDGVWVTWAQKYQMESASFDNAFVEVREAGGGNEQKLWEWIGATMTAPMGSVTLQQSAGWGTHTADISDYQGSQIELRFHVNSDSSVQMSGLAVDDVAVLACIPATGDADINVNPTSLATTLAPDEQDTLVLNISNLGGDDLTWNIVEQTAPVGTTTLSVAPVANPGLLLSATGGEANPVIPVGSAGPNGLLYDQTDNPSTTSSSSQEFEADLAAYTNQAADDFVIPAEDVSWTIDTVFVLGAYFNGTGPMPFVNVYFYEDNGGLPGAEIKAYDGLTSFTDSAGDLTIDLSADPIVLPAGTYWLSVQADMDFTPTGQWGWTDRLVQTGNGAAWRNPGDGFGTGCTNWANRVGCGVGSAPDHLFQLGGTTGGSGGGCSANDLPWVSVSPANGITPGGSTTTVNVTFDAAGLTPGVYTGELCIESNDPDEPEVIVPLSLTVADLGAPDIDVDPTSLSSALDPNQQDTQTLDISNLGGATLDWSIDEATPAGHTRSPFVDVIADGSFEAGTPNPSWEEFSQNFGTPLCDFFSCGADLPHTGDWYVWFGGTSSPETGYVSQTVTIPAGTATLSYWLMMGNGGNTGTLAVSIDGDVIATYTEADTGDFAAYTQVTHDVSAYADGGDHVVQFLSVTNAGAGPLNFFVDDVVLDVVTGGGGGGCDSPTDIPWLSVNPAAGSTAGGDTSSVDVTFDSTGLAAGVYDALLCINSNDPDEPVVEVPVELTVSEPSGDPDIDVDPTSLSSTLPMNGQETQALDISNVGGGNLNWNIIEQGPSAAMMTRRGAVAVNPGLDVSAPVGGAVISPLAPSSVLYDQTDNPSTTSSSSQEFEADLAAYTNQAADDFVIPAEDVSWTIDTVFVLGAYFNGTGPMPFVNVYFYEDNGGLPGAEIKAYDGLTSFTDSAGDLTIDLSADPIVLPAGTYWLSVQADMDFTPTGQWGWTDRLVQTGNGAAWRNPGDGFGTGCTNWANRVGCGVGSAPDHLFQLGGTIGGVVGCTPNDLPWASVSPANGSTPGGGTSTVNVTFDATGLTPGVYTGELCIESNDPDEPQVIVPLSLTVEDVSADPDIDVDPASLASTLPVDGQETQGLDISNLGGADLTWDVVEQEAAYTIALFEGNLIQDGGFEAGTPNPYWTEYSLNFGTTLCDAGCGFGGGSGPHSGSWWNWFGGTTANEIGYTTQDVVIPAGTATLSFWLEIPVAGTTGFLNVEMDGDIIATYTDADAGTYATYTLVTLDVSAYADGNSHTVEFYSETFAGAAVLNFFVDDVELTVVAGGVSCDAPSDLPWVSVSPTNGTTAPGGTSTVDVTFDATGLTPGVYTGNLCIASNDPDEPEVLVPLALTVEEVVEPPAPEIALSKTVGTDPAVCATSDLLEVPAGTEVTYCYEVTNTGTVNVTTHDLVDSELGNLLTGYAYDLAPGESFYITATAVINEDTTNTATWTAYAGDQQATAQDSATVLIIEDEEGPEENLTFLPLMYKGGAEDQPVSENTAKPAGFLSLLLSLPFFGLVVRRKA